MFWKCLRQEKCSIRSGKTGNINEQLVLQHCSKTSWNAMMRVLPPTSQTCLATNQVVASCETFLQKVESSSTFCIKFGRSYALYRPKANLFSSKWLNSRVWRDCRVILSSRSLCSRNLKTDLLQDRFWTWLVKRKTSLSDSFWSNVEKQAPSFCERFTVA